MKERLQKLIAQAGLTSRRDAEEWIQRGRVLLNGRVAQVGEKADLNVDKVSVDGRELKGAEEQVVLLLNKPRGYVCTLKDPQNRPLVTQLVASIPQRLFPVGRLDFNSEGLILLTNDGDLAQKLAHPRHHVKKTYLVKVRGHLSEKAQMDLARGIVLEDGLTAPAEVDRVRHRNHVTWFEITLHEGRNRQVRRMCEALGHKVVRLKRIRIDFLELGELKPGGFRKLGPVEIRRLKNQ